MWFVVFLGEFVLFFLPWKAVSDWRICCFLSYMVIWVFFSSHGMSNHLFQGEYVWNMLQSVKLWFFPTRKLCIIKERVGWVLGLTKRRLYFSRTSRKPWCSPQRLPTIRVALMPCCSRSPWGYVPNWPKWSSVFLSKWLSVHCSPVV